MRNEAASRGRPVGCWATGYPVPSDRHPVYLYGTFPPGFLLTRPGGPADLAVLGIREDAGAAPPGIPSHRHADVKAGDSHHFMFGVAAEQEPVVPPEEPVFCFWDVGAA